MFKVVMTLGDFLCFALLGLVFLGYFIIFLIVKWEEFKIHRRNKKKKN